MSHLLRNKHHKIDMAHLLLLHKIDMVHQRSQVKIDMGHLKADHLHEIIMVQHLVLVTIEIKVDMVVSRIVGKRIRIVDKSMMVDKIYQPLVFHGMRSSDHVRHCEINNQMAFLLRLIKKVTALQKMNRMKKRKQQKLLLQNSRYNTMILLMMRKMKT